MTRQTRRTLCTLVLASQTLTACATWRVVGVTPKEFVETQHPKSIQVSEKGGAEYVLDAPVVSGNSLSGTVKGVPIAFAGPVKDRERVVPLAAIDYVAVRKVNAGATALVVFLGVGIAVFAVFRSAYSDCGC